MRRVLFLELTLALTMACAPGQNGRPGEAPDGTGLDARGPKVITIAILREPNSFHRDLNQGTGATGGNTQVLYIPQNFLAVETDRGVFEAQLAAEQISTERGTWRLNPDGSMDTTWKLRPNVKWHDGAPFTSDDLLFSYGVYKDPDVPTASGQALGLMVAAAAPDPLTFVVHWSSPYVKADEAQGLIPMPRHLLEETYRTDKANFANSPRLGAEFIGLGPYRLASWQGAIQMDFVRFDDYTWAARRWTALSCGSWRTPTRWWPTSSQAR